MWVSYQPSQSNHDPSTSFITIYSTNIRSYLSSDKNYTDSQDQRTDQRIDQRTPILSSPYDWNRLESEINSLIQGKTPQQLYPMIPSYSVENTEKGRCERLQLLLYGLSHMTEDAVFIGERNESIRQIQESLGESQHNHSNKNNVNLMFFFMVLFLIILGFYLWNTPSTQLSPSTKTWVAGIAIVLLAISMNYM
jgi:hypothetical protein